MQIPLPRRRNLHTNRGDPARLPAVLDLTDLAQLELIAAEVLPQL
jgi:hypothetical protein